MSGGFKWGNTKAGRGNPDDRLGWEWRKGPSDRELMDRQTEALPARKRGPSTSKIKLTTVVRPYSKGTRKPKNPNGAT